MTTKELLSRVVLTELPWENCHGKGRLWLLQTPVFMDGTGTRTSVFHSKREALRERAWHRSIIKQNAKGKP